MKAHVTSVLSSNDAAKTRPWICWIPGGPGLSSTTLRSMDLLARSFDMLYVDPPGTGEAPTLESAPTFNEFVLAIETAIAKEGPRPVILAGHSFGGIVAAELILRGKLPAVGYIAAASPLSAESYHEAIQQCALYKTDVLTAAELAFEQTPTDETFRNWLSEYGELFFLKSRVTQGRELIRNDRACGRLSMSTMEILKNGNYLKRISDASIPKLFLSGSEDKLILPKCISQEAKACGAQTATIEGAAHFISFDQPETVAGWIEKFFIDGKNERSKST